MQTTSVACPRNQQDPTAVLRDESGGILLGECQDGGQGACQNDVRWLTNRAKNSHQPFRRREGAMSKFRDVKTLQKFASIHASIHNHFNLDRHLNSRETFKQNRAAAMAEWRQLAA